MTVEEVHKAIEKATYALGECAEHVQIMATWSSEGLCHRYFYGNGNWYARQGLAHEFLAQDIARTNAREIAEATKPPDDDSEEWKKSSGP